MLLPPSLDTHPGCISTDLEKIFRERLCQFLYLSPGLCFWQSLALPLPGPFFVVCDLLNFFCFKLGFFTKILYVILTKENDTEKGTSRLSKLMSFTLNCIDFEPDY